MYMYLTLVISLNRYALITHSPYVLNRPHVITHPPLLVDNDAMLTLFILYNIQRDTHIHLINFVLI